LFRYTFRVISSPEPKAQVGFSVCPMFVDYLSVCLVGCLSVNFSHFQLFVQYHWANFQQDFAKIILGGGNSGYFK
jgi:hypothetical protein